MYNGQEPFARGKIYFNKDGDYLVELNYVLYKVNDRRNGTLLFERIPWSLSSTSYKNMLFGGDDKDPDGVYWCKKIELTGENQYGDGLATDNKNNKPIIVRCLMWIKVVNGVVAEFEQKDCKVLPKFNNTDVVQLNIGYFGASNVAYNGSITNRNLYYKININDSNAKRYYNYSEKNNPTTSNFLNGFESSPHNVYVFDLITMVDSYDDIGNSNDWLYSLICSVGVYPLPANETNTPN